MTSENKKLQQQVQELRIQLKRYEKSNELLKKRVAKLTSRSSQGTGNVVVSEAEHALFDSQCEAAARVKNVFFENVSHEIRSSMNGVVGMTNLVLGTELNDEQRYYLEMVETSVERLLLVVNEVMDFSRIENGELELAQEAFNLKESLDHDLYVLSVAAKNKGLDLSCTVSPDVPAHIYGDGFRLVQVITNMVNNAIRFTDNGDVSITIDNAGYNKAKNIQLRFKVSDSGRGIDPQRLEVVKNYFKQDKKLHIATPLSLGTTGLGLTVTSQLVKIMGGSIDVESGADGSTFTVILPFKEVAVLADEDEKNKSTLENIQGEPSYILRGKKILLADDEYIHRVLIKAILEQLGVDVDTVETGKEAVALACKGDYQLVLMDVQMDGVDGLEATRRIRSFEKKQGGHIGIIALTALALPGDRERCIQAGMDDYLPKPVQREELIEVVSQFLTSRVLVVGADPQTQTKLVQTLVESGWKVTIAESRRSALYEASLSHFDLIILDISTLESEAMLAAKVVRKLEEFSGQHARIIGIASEGQPYPEDNYLDGCLEKPLSEKGIIEQLEVVEKVA